MLMRNYKIPWIIRPPLIKRNPMVNVMFSVDGFPTPPADQTTLFICLRAHLKPDILDGVMTGRGEFTGATIMPACFCLFRMPLTPQTICLTALLWILFTSQTGIFTLFFPIPLFPPTTYLTGFFWISLFPSAIRLTDLFWIPLNP